MPQPGGTSFESKWYANITPGVGTITSNGVDYAVIPVHIIKNTPPMSAKKIIPIEWQVFPGLDFISQATLSRPISYFDGKHGLRITNDVDDLDFSEGALFQFGKNTFAIMRYRGHPQGTSSVYLLTDPRDVPIVANEIRELLSEFGLVEADILKMRE
jgi:hypothetical protein